MGDAFKRVAKVITDNSVVISVLCDIFSPSTYRDEEKRNDNSQQIEPNPIAKNLDK